MNSDTIKKGRKQPQKMMLIWIYNTSGSVSGEIQQKGYLWYRFK